MSRGIRNPWAFIGAIALMGIVYLFMSSSERVPELPELYPMPAFSLLNEQGEPFGAGDVEGKVVVANFIFTNCPTVCPMLTSQMAALHRELGDQPGIHFLSFSVDPRNDTPEVLRAYGEGFGQDPTRWTFLTGDLDTISEAVEKGFKIGMEGAGDPDATAFDIVHGEHFVLVDASGVIRGYFRPDPESQKQLILNARELAKRGRS